MGLVPLLALLGGVAACGKRGDPLPPLRPVPAKIDVLEIRQEGETIRLRWTTPSRNRDGTTENVDLRKAQILRRVIDVETLVEEQTRVVEPETASDTESEPIGEEEVLDPAGPSEEEAEKPSTEAPDEEVGTTAPRHPSAAPGEASELDGTIGGAPEESTEDLTPAVEPPPQLQIPPFATEAKLVAELEATGLGEALTYEEAVDPEWVGKRIEYAVAHMNRKGRASPLSPIVQIEPVEELEIPEAPSAEAQDGYVSIRWGPAELPEGLGYAVYRRGENRRGYPDRPLNGEPLEGPVFRDATALFGARWCYTVRTVVKPPPPPVVTELESEEEGTSPAERPTPQEPSEPAAMEPAEMEPATPAHPEAELETAAEAPAEETVVIVPVVPPVPSPMRLESLPSEEICLTPVDTFAPAPPDGLVAVASAEGVLLSWRAVPADDVAGYRVYRSSSADGPYRLVSPDLVRSPTFTDETAEVGETYFYVVTALDDAPRQNESALSEPSEARRPEPR